MIKSWLLIITLLCSFCCQASAYLKAHSEDAIKWQGYDREEMKKALEKGHVFLSIGFKSCLWCHNLQKEAFTRKDIGDLINSHFQAFLMDSFENPSDDSAYQNLGVKIGGKAGWPQNLLILKGGRTVLSFNFLKADEMKKIIEQTLELSRTRPELLLGRSLPLPVFAKEELKLNPLDARAELMKNLDFSTGGIKDDSKEIPGELLYLSLLSDDKKLEEWARITVNNMIKSPIHDHHRGGFFRYAQEQNWSSPHFEKLAADNLWMALVLKKLSEKEKTFELVYLKTMNFIQNELVANYVLNSIDAFPLPGKKFQYKSIEDADKQKLWQDRETKFPSDHGKDEDFRILNNIIYLSLLDDSEKEKFLKNSSLLNKITVATLEDKISALYFLSEEAKLSGTVAFKKITAALVKDLGQTGELTIEAQVKRHLLNFRSSKDLKLLLPADSKKGPLFYMLYSTLK